LEHAAGVADAEHLFTGQLPVDVAGQSCQVVDAVEVIFTVQDRLVEMGDAPPMRDVVAEYVTQSFSGVAGVGVAPSTEGCQQFAVGVQGQVAVHHGRDAEGAH
jgi:hypothetical protein